MNAIQAFLYIVFPISYRNKSRVMCNSWSNTICTLCESRGQSISAKHFV